MAINKLKLFASAFKLKKCEKCPYFKNLYNSKNVTRYLSPEYLSSDYFEVEVALADFYKADKGLYEYVSMQTKYLGIFTIVWTVCILIVVLSDDASLRFAMGIISALEAFLMLFRGKMSNAK